MPLRILLIAFLLVSLWVGCSKAGKKEEAEVTGTPGKTQEPVAEEKVQKESAVLPRILYPVKYTDGARWSNGIDTEKKNVFFIAVAKNTPTPIKIGYRLKFASAGEAVVRNVYLLKQEDKDSIFIRVDKNLDPGGDGAPHPIYVKGFELKTVNYSKANKWSRGINLENPSMFFFKWVKDEPTPLQVGDRLKFARTGEARVVKLARLKAQDNSVSIFVIVDKPLNPSGDGNPNPIEVIFAD